MIRLEKINENNFIEAFNLKLNKEQRNKLFDLAAKVVEDIPLDIKETIINDPEWIEKIRNNKE